MSRFSMQWTPPIPTTLRLLPSNVKRQKGWFVALATCHISTADITWRVDNQSNSHLPSCTYLITSTIDSLSIKRNQLNVHGKWLDAIKFRSGNNSEKTWQVWTWGSTGVRREGPWNERSLVGTVLRGGTRSPIQKPAPLRPCSPNAFLSNRCIVQCLCSSLFFVLNFLVVLILNLTLF